MKIFNLLRPKPQKDRSDSRAARSTAWVGLLLLGLVTGGCGNTLYLVQVSQAEAAFEEAKKLGAEERSPYEFYAAKARLDEAKIQAAHAEYGNASNLSDEAAEYANKAINNTKRARDSMGAPPAPTGVNQ